MIEIKNLTCRYGKKTVLDSVSLDISDHISILGSNGSGKSTLAKCICGLKDYEGKIFLDKKDVNLFYLKEIAKKVSYVGSKLHNFDEFITLWEFVLLGRYAYKKDFLDYVDEDRQRAKEVLDFFGIYHLKKQSVSSLSSGESALALIAQAVCADTKLIIFDEPTANLDPKNSKMVARYIKKLSYSKQIILITHDLQLGNFLDFDVAFIKDKNITYHKNFFDDKILESLYDVGFSSLAVCYDEI